MDRVRLGNSELQVPPIAIGTAHFGNLDAARWHVGDSGARALVQAALDRGLTFFDTASSYGGGASEARLGAAIDALGVRRETQVATKVFFPTGPGPDDRGLSHRHIMKAFDSSLERLRTDYIDLLYIHRWDPETPIEETLAALEQLVRSGRVRTLGASSMSAWRLMKALSLQRALGFSPFSAMQGHYNLLYREEEREMLPLCREEGLRYLAWSPLARGLLAGAQADPLRLAADPLLASWRCETDEGPIFEALHAAAAECDAPPAALALAWLRGAGAIPVIGATSADQIDIAIRCLSVELGQTAIAKLERHYRPRAVIGFDPQAEVSPAGPMPQSPPDLAQP